LLVGIAYQLGALPIPADAVEAAIRLNGVAVEMNLAAFRWGRLRIAEPAQVTAATEGNGPEARVSTPDGEDELTRVLRIRGADLETYQNAAYGKHYRALVERFSVAERAVAPKSQALSLAVARNLYKLMAYKDEYEVARLHLDPTWQAILAREHGANDKVFWHLHPTFLRVLGFRNKVRLGAWFRPVLVVLRALKGLRGGIFDPFRYGRLRKIERALIRHYIRSIETVCGRLDAKNLADATELAAAPDIVRGYEDVKLANVVRYLRAVYVLQGRLGIDVELDDDLAALLPAMEDIRGPASNLKAAE
jgi:indolepyruvate ferredoxin oxidoreductase